MHVTHCYVCNRQSGFARRLGWGTFFMVILTAGFWLLTIPFYPKRCTTCGCTAGGAARATLNPAPPSRNAQLWQAYALPGAVALVVIFFLLTKDDKPANGPALTNTSSVYAPVSSSIPAGKDDLFVAVTKVDEDTLKDGSVMRVADGHLAKPPNTEFILVCEAALSDCSPLVAGNTYRMYKLASHDPRCPYTEAKVDCVHVYSGYQGGPVYGIQSTKQVEEQ